MKKHITPFHVFLSALLTCSILVAVEPPALVKLDPVAANGDCLPPMDHSTATALFDKYDIKLSGTVKPTDRIAVARVIASIDEISNGKCHLPRGASFAFRTKSGGISRYDGKHIQINAANQNEKALKEEKQGHGGCNNTGLIAHELCHRIGNQGLSGGRGISAYDFYKSKVPKKCALTRYAARNKNKNPRNEEFAEVCSAFITNPTMILENTSASCAQAMDVFKEIIGKKLQPRINCNPPQKPYLLPERKVDTSNAI